MKILIFINVMMVSFMAFANTDMVILDVRTPEEYAQKHVKDSVNYDFRADGFDKKIAGLDKNKTYKLYCKSGGRASKAMAMMKDMGFKNVENLGGAEDASKALKMDLVTGSH